MIKPFQEIQFEQLQRTFVEDTIPNGKRLIIIGTAEKGDYSTPYIIQDMQKLEEDFGDGTLLSTYQEFAKPFGPFTAYVIRTEEGQIEEAIGILRHIEFDYVLFDESIRFETHFSAILDFIDVAYEKESKGELIHAFLSTTIQTQAEKEALFNRIESLKEWVGVEQEEYGKYLSIVYEQLKDQYATAYYAALYMELGIAESPVNKRLPGAELSIHLTSAEETWMGDNGVIVLKNSFHHGVIFANSTCAVQTQDSVHKSFPNFKIAQYASSLVKKTLKPFIGKPQQLLDDIFLMDVLDSIGVHLLDAGYIKDLSYSFSRNKLKGDIYIEFDVVPIFSIYSMKNRTQIRAVLS